MKKWIALLSAWILINLSVCALADSRTYELDDGMHIYSTPVMIHEVGRAKKETTHLLEPGGSPTSPLRTFLFLFRLKCKAA